MTNVLTLKSLVMAIALTLTFSYMMVRAQDESAKRNVEGVWRVSVTPRNCTTGVPIPNAAFEALMTFHKDGTLSAWFQNATITTTRSPSYGLWKSESGWSDYSFKFVHLRYSSATGAFLGRQESGGTLILGVNRNEFTTDGGTTVFNVDGVPGTPSCSTSVGARFELDQ